MVTIYNYNHYNDWDPTQPTPTNQSYSGPYTINTSRTYSTGYHAPRIKKETKKERQDRISRERHLASMKTINQLPLNQIQIKQICKPRHRQYLHQLR